MDEFTERLGMTKSGLWIIVVLVAAIGAAYFLLPNKTKPMRAKNFDSETIQQAQMAADSGRSPAAASPDAAPAAAPAPAPAPTTAAMDVTPVSTISKATLDDLRTRVGREDPFKPLEDFETKKDGDKDKDKDKNKKQEPAAAAASYTPDPAMGTPFGPLPSLDFEEDLPKVEVRPQAPADVMDYFQPSFLLSVISTAPDGTSYVIINGEILREGQKIPGTGYTIVSIDAIGLNEVVLRNDKKQEIVLKIKQTGGEFYIRPSADGRHLTITNQDELNDRNAKPAGKPDKESDDKGGSLPPWTLPPLN